MEKCTKIVVDVNKALAVTDFEADLAKFATSKISIHHFSDAGQKGQIVTIVTIVTIPHSFHINSTFLEYKESS